MSGGPVRARGGLTPQESEHLLRRGVGLAEGGDAGLEADLRLGQVGGFQGEVGIADARFAGGQVGQLRRSEVDGVVELVLPAADDGSTVHRFLYFPSENHWVLQPQHAKLWYQAVLAFLAGHVLGADGQWPEMLE